MTRIEELLTKRKEATLTNKEKAELFELIKTIPKEEFAKIDPNLLIPSNSMRLDKMIHLLDKLIEKIDESQ